MPLGSLPEPLILLLRASKTQKILVSHCKITFLKMMFLGTLRLLMSSLESSCCILAHYDSKTDPKTDPKMDPKWTQTWTQICSIFCSIFEQFVDIFGSHFGVKKSTDEILSYSESVVLQWENYIFYKHNMIYINVRCM